MSIKVTDLLNVLEKGGSYKTLTESMSSPKEEKIEEFKPDFELDDDGEEYMPVGVNGLLAASEKLLAMNRGLAEQDERDSLRYQKLVRPSDMFRERIKMDSGKLARSVMYQASRRKNLSGLLPNAFSGYIDAVMKGNPLTSPLEEINPMQLVENARRISKMGPGGIPSADSITEEAQAVHPSQFGFIDPIAGPECLVDDKYTPTSVFTNKGWVRIHEITKDHKILCMVNGLMVFHYPDRVIHEHYNGDVVVIAEDNSHMPLCVVTPAHRVANMNRGGIGTVLAKDIEKGVTLDIPLVFESGVLAAYKSETKKFVGDVHCVTVPGGLFCISVNGLPGFWTGNSEKAGVDVRAAWGTKVGSNGRIYQKFYDKRNKCYRWLNAGDVASLVVKIPD